MGPDGAIPPGAFTQGFSWTPLHTNSVLGQRGELDFAAPGVAETGFFACPAVPAFVTGATYRIFAAVPGFAAGEDCVELGRLRTTEFKEAEFGAWQYA